MTRVILKNKPLVEAIFEMRWHLNAQPNGAQSDPHYKILLGRLSDRLSSQYPIVETLPTASMPDEIVPYVVQYRWRVSEASWPVIQLGPGIITLNSADDYIWDIFEILLADLVRVFFDVYPKKSDLRISNLVLRYVDAVPFNFEKQDIFEFFQSQMKLNINLYNGLFEGTGVGRSPLALDFRTAFPSENPKGVISLRFAMGSRAGEPSIIWETIFQRDEDVPQTITDIENWTQGAHTITSDWFFKIISGELQRRFE